MDKNLKVYAECVECGQRRPVAVEKFVNELQSESLPFCYCTWRNRASKIRVILIWDSEEKKDWGQG